MDYIKMNNNNDANRAWSVARPENWDATGWDPSFKMEPGDEHTPDAEECAKIAFNALQTVFGDSINKDGLFVYHVTDLMTDLLHLLAYMGESADDIAVHVMEVSRQFEEETNEKFRL